MSMGSCRMARAYISLDAIMEDQISSCTMIDMNTHMVGGFFFRKLLVENQVLYVLYGYLCDAGDYCIAT
jgi:diaminopimelate decarboxylase